MMKIYAKVFPYQPKEGSDSKVLGYAILELGAALTVNDVVIRQGEKGPFVSMPSYKTKDGEYKEVCHPITKEFRDAISSTVLDAYKRSDKEAVRNGDTSPNVDVSLNKHEKDGIKALGSIVLGKEFCVNSIVVRENKNGNLMAYMPSTSYDKDGTKAYKVICAPTGDYAEKGTIVGRIINVAKEKLAEKEPLAAKVASAEETKKTQEKKTEEKKAPEKKTGAKSSKKKAKTEKEDRE